MVCVRLLYYITVWRKVLNDEWRRGNNDSSVLRTGVKESLQITERHED